MSDMVKIHPVPIGKGFPLVLIAGPCVIEDYQTTFDIASFLKDLTHRLGIPFIFKASYDKANRTSLSSYRGPGLADGLKILAEIKKELAVKILSDVHGPHEVAAAAQVLDIIQVPALLCRQTDLLTEVAKTGKPVNVKKGQFLSPWDISHVIEKITASGNDRIMITERGSVFGYNNLVVDFRSIQIIRDMGWPVIFDATHSVQLPGGEGKSSGGQREFAPALARAAVAAGADGIFLEVHKDPAQALCDGPNSLQLDGLEQLLTQFLAIRKAVAP
ncbi:MAG: 3-deoxy-8-phosphooctulonate synthase [Desulfobacterales bacterium]|nr:3-deoxy-8-phosphooctulonate synthase [Desulfobacterales bacterium]